MKGLVFTKRKSILKKNCFNTVLSFWKALLMRSLYTFFAKQNIQNVDQYLKFWVLIGFATEKADLSFELTKRHLWADGVPFIFFSKDSKNFNDQANERTWSNERERSSELNRANVVNRTWTIKRSNERDRASVNDQAIKQTQSSIVVNRSWTWSIDRDQSIMNVIVVNRSWSIDRKKKKGT